MILVQSTVVIKLGGGDGSDRGKVYKQRWSRTYAPHSRLLIPIDITKKMQLILNLTWYNSFVSLWFSPIIIYCSRYKEFSLYK